MENPLKCVSNSPDTLMSAPSLSSRTTACEDRSIPRPIVIKSQLEVDKSDTGLPPPNRWCNKDPDPYGVGTITLAQLNRMKKEAEFLDQLFPWLVQFRKQCVAALLEPSIQKLDELMTYFRDQVSRAVRMCYSRTNRAAKFKNSLNDSLLFFYLHYNDLKKPLEHSFYLDKMSDLMTFYMEMEIKASRRGKESATTICSKLITSLHLFLDKSIDHILDSILKSRFFIKSYREICIPILKQFLDHTTPRNISKITYVRYILAFRVWKRVVRGVDQKRVVNQAAISHLQPPPDFREAIKSGILNGILPTIPNSKSDKDITKFLIHAKFNARAKTKEFLKLTISHKHELESDLDKSLFFSETADDIMDQQCSADMEEASIVGSCPNRTSSIISDIWADLMKQQRKKCEQTNNNNSDSTDSNNVSNRRKDKPAGKPKMLAKKQMKKHPVKKCNMNKKINGKCYDCHRPNKMVKKKRKLKPKVRKMKVESKANEGDRKCQVVKKDSGESLAMEEDSCKSLAEVVESCAIVAMEKEAPTTTTGTELMGEPSPILMEVEKVEDTSDEQPEVKILCEKKKSVQRSGAGENKLPLEEESTLASSDVTLKTPIPPSEKFNALVAPVDDTVVVTVEKSSEVISCPVPSSATTEPISSNIKVKVEENSLASSCALNTVETFGNTSSEINLTPKRDNNCNHDIGVPVTINEVVVKQEIIPDIQLSPEPDCPLSPELDSRLAPEAEQILSTESPFPPEPQLISSTDSQLSPEPELRSPTDSLLSPVHKLISPTDRPLSTEPERMSSHIPDPETELSDKLNILLCFDEKTADIMDINIGGVKENSGSPAASNRDKLKCFSRELVLHKTSSIVTAGFEQIKEEHQHKRYMEKYEEERKQQPKNPPFLLKSSSLFIYPGQQQLLNTRSSFSLSKMSAYPKVRSWDLGTATFGMRGSSLFKDKNLSKIGGMLSPTRTIPVTDRFVDANGHSMSDFELLAGRRQPPCPQAFAKKSFSTFQNRNLSPDNENEIYSERGFEVHKDFLIYEDGKRAVLDSKEPLLTTGCEEPLNIEVTEKCTNRGGANLSYNIDNLLKIVKKDGNDSDTVISCEQLCSSNPPLTATHCIDENLTNKTLSYLCVCDDHLKGSPNISLQDSSFLLTLNNDGNTLKVRSLSPDKQRHVNIDVEAPKTATQYAFSINRSSADESIVQQQASVIRNSINYNNVHQTPITSPEHDTYQNNYHRNSLPSEQIRNSDASVDYVTSAVNVESGFSPFHRPVDSDSIHSFGGQIDEMTADTKSVPPENKTIDRTEVYNSSSDECRGMDKTKRSKIPKIFMGISRVAQDKKLKDKQVRQQYSSPSKDDAGTRNARSSTPPVAVVESSEQLPVGKKDFSPEREKKVPSIKIKIVQNTVQMENGNDEESYAEVICDGRVKRVKNRRKHRHREHHHHPKVQNFVSPPAAPRPRHPLSPPPPPSTPPPPPPSPPPPPPPSSTPPPLSPVTGLPFRPEEQEEENLVIPCKEELKENSCDMDLNVQRYHFMYECKPVESSMLAPVSEEPGMQMSDALARGLITSEVDRLHIATCEIDRSLCTQQFNFRDFYPYVEHTTLPIPHPKSMKTAEDKPFVRCPCLQCNENLATLITNYRKLTQYRNSRLRDELTYRKYQDQELIKRIEHSFDEYNGGRTKNRMLDYEYRKMLEYNVTEPEIKSSSTEQDQSSENANERLKEDVKDKKYENEDCNKKIGKSLYSDNDSNSRDEKFETRYSTVDQDQRSNSAEQDCTLPLKKRKAMTQMIPESEMVVKKHHYVSENETCEKVTGITRNGVSQSYSNAAGNQSLSTIGLTAEEQQELKNQLQIHQKLQKQLFEQSQEWQKQELEEQKRELEKQKRQREVQRQQQRAVQRQKEQELQRQKEEQELQRLKELEFQRKKEQEFQRQKERESQRQQQQELQRQQKLECQRQQKLELQRQRQQQQQELKEQQELELQRRERAELQRQQQQEMQKQKLKQELQKSKQRQELQNQKQQKEQQRQELQKQKQQEKQKQQPELSKRSLQQKQQSKTKDALHKESRHLNKNRPESPQQNNSRSNSKRPKANQGIPTPPSPPISSMADRNKAAETLLNFAYGTIDKEPVLHLKRSMSQVEIEDDEITEAAVRRRRGNVHHDFRSLTTAAQSAEVSPPATSSSSTHRDPLQRKRSRRHSVIR